MFADGTDVSMGQLFIYLFLNRNISHRTNKQTDICHTRANSYFYIKQNFHSDYFSGWDETELQNVLDNCENPSEAANPDAFCSDWLTFRGKGKEEGVQTQDDEIRYRYCPEGAAVCFQNVIYSQFTFAKSLHLLLGQALRKFNHP